MPGRIDWLRFSTSPEMSMEQSPYLIMSMADRYGEHPCHRVVNHAGRTVPGWTEQRELLEAEGVEFRENGNVDMRRFRM